MKTKRNNKKQTQQQKQQQKQQQQFKVNRYTFKADNYFKFILFTSENGTTLKGKNYRPRDQIYFLQSSPLFKRGLMYMKAKGKS